LVPVTLLIRSSVATSISATARIAGLIPFVASVWIAAILLALFTGYLSLAYFLTGKLLWISVIAATTYLLIAFFGDICETLLSPKHPSGLA
ncbi:hypothetical protein, partial [Pseudomonas aeruginosa]